MKKTLVKKPFHRLRQTVISSFAALLLLSNIGFSHVSAAERTNVPTNITIEANAHTTADQGINNSTVMAGPCIAVVDTKAGKLQGYIKDGIYNYKGVEYAHAKRFMPPVKVANWSGIHTAMSYGSIAPQLTDKKNDIFPPHWYWPHWEAHNQNQDENCQNLNIWTPGIKDGKKRPVMIWLHGGGFSMGSASVEDVYDGQNLSHKGDIVVVSVNHRLNSLGYLNLSAYGEKYKYSANVGILDIVAALQWVHDNIEQFGGDPNNVTLFGQSGGGAKILTLMSMPRTKGLFNKAIVESGAIETMGMTLPDNNATKPIAALTLEKLGLKANQVDELQNIPYEKLSEAANSAYTQIAKELGPGKLYPTMGWAPVVDGNIIPKQPVEGGFQAQAKDIPLLIGTVLNEWTTMDQMVNMTSAQSDNKNTWSNKKIRERLEKKYGAQTDDIIKAFRKAYPDKKDVDALFVDSWLRTQAVHTANLKYDQQGAPVYNYIFTWETPVMGGYAMAYHCSELPFVFDNIALSGTATGATPEAYALSDKISQAWINFARTGNPSTNNLPTWPAYTRKNGATMILDNTSVVRYHHDDALMKFLAPNYHE